MPDQPIQPKSTKIAVAVNTVSQLVGKAVSGGATFVISILLAHAYGAQGYGDFTKITTYVAVFYLFADFGLNAIYLQQSHSSPENNQTSWQTLVALRLIMGILFMFAALSILVFLPGYGDNGYPGIIKLGIILYCPTILFQALINTANAIFQKNLRYDLATLALSVGSILSLVLIWISVRIFLPSAALSAGIVSLLIGTGISAGLSMMLIRRYIGWHIRFNFRDLKRFALSALPLGLTLVCNVIYFRADNFILTLTRTTAEVGLYGFAYRIFEFVLVIPTFFMNAVYPLMVKRGGDNGNVSPDLKRLILRSAIVLFPVSLAVAAGIWIAAPLVTLVRPDFAGSVAPLRILAFAIPLFFVSSLTMWTLISLKRQRLLLVIYGLSMLFNIVANLVYIPQYGYIAAAWTTGISEAVVLALSVLVIIRHSSVSSQNLVQ
jgi:O-antigen/teichoic acid export membrane protein